MMLLLIFIKQFLFTRRNLPKIFLGNITLLEEGECADTESSPWVSLTRRKRWDSPSTTTCGELLRESLK